MRQTLATWIAGLPVLAMMASFYLWIRRTSLADSKRQKLLAALLHILTFILLSWLASPYLLGDKSLFESAGIYLLANALAAIVICIQIVQCHRNMRHK